MFIFIEKSESNIGNFNYYLLQNQILKKYSFFRLPSTIKIDCVRSLIFDHKPVSMDLAQKFFRFQYYFTKENYDENSLAPFLKKAIME